MKPSPIRFSDPYLEECEFRINKEYLRNGTEESDAPHQIKMPFHVESSVSEPEGDVYPVSLRVTVGKESDELPFWAHVTMLAFFTIKDDVSEESKKSFLSINAPALLYSYIRPVIASLTENSPFPPYHLPFMDFTDEEASVGEK